MLQQESADGAPLSDQSSKAPGTSTSNKLSQAQNLQVIEEEGPTSDSGKKHKEAFETQLNFQKQYIQGIGGTGAAKPKQKDKSFQDFIKETLNSTKITEPKQFSVGQITQMQFNTGGKPGGQKKDAKVSIPKEVPLEKKASNKASSENSYSQVESRVKQQIQS